MKPEISEKGILNLGRHVLLEEAKELEAIAGRLDETFVKAVTLILNCKGRVVVSGVGKSGHIARKIRHAGFNRIPCFLRPCRRSRTRRSGYDHQRRCRHCHFLLRHHL